MTSKNILFIHIPKTGGNSFLNHPFYLEKIVHLGHFEAQKLDYTKNNYDTIFTIVRNPYSRLVSAYFYLKKGGMKNKLDLSYQKLLEPYDTFDSFVKHIKEEPEFINEIIHMVPQVDFIYDKKLGLLVDDILYNENLNEDFFIFCDKYSNTCPKILEENKSKHNDYKTYYNKELQDIVYNLYKDDFVKLGYNYDYRIEDSNRKYY